MSRRSRNYKREVMVDPRFGTVQVSKFINAIMMEGKKSVAETIVYNAFDIVEKKASQPPLEVFEEALNKVRPEIEVRSRRVGGATYQVPMDVRQTRAFALAFRWLIAAARNRSEKTFQERLGLEIFDASQGRGAAVKKREDTVKMAEANRAFAHYRW